MNSPLILCALLAAAALLVWFFVRKSRSSGTSGDDASASAAAASAPPEEELNRLFALGLDPSSESRTVMYALETCRHCRRTREFLEANKLPCQTIYVDQYVGEQRSALMNKVRCFNPRGSFPTIVLPNGKIVVGYREQLLREALIHDSSRPA